MNIKAVFYLVSLSLLFCPILSPLHGLAQTVPSPREAVLEMVNRMKQQASMVPMLDFVHWPTAFEGLAVSERGKLGISSPEGMRSYFLSILSEPEKLPQMMEDKLAALPPEERAQVQQNMDQLVLLMQTKKREMREKISRTEYSIGEIAVQGRQATIELVSSLDGQTKRTILPMELHGARWYLPTMKLLEEQKRPQ